MACNTLAPPPQEGTQYYVTHPNVLLLIDVRFSLRFHLGFNVCTDININIVFSCADSFDNILADILVSEEGKSYIFIEGTEWVITNNK